MTVAAGQQRQAKRAGVLAAALIALAIALPATAQAAPKAASAYYVRNTTVSGLNSTLYTWGCNFAKAHPNTDQLAIIDFGQPTKIGPGTYGALDFNTTNPTVFSNAEILTALENFADGHHNCYIQGTTTISLGVNNYHISSSLGSEADATNDGYYIGQRSAQLGSYESSHGYNRQSYGGAIDLELDWQGPIYSTDWTNGFNNYANQYASGDFYYDYGDAAGCPPYGSCNNGWSVPKVYNVAWGILHAESVPEIYYSGNGHEWTNIAGYNGSSGLAYWDGATGEISSASGHLTPSESWTTLNNDMIAAGHSGIGNYLPCFGC